MKLGPTKTVELLTTECCIVGVKPCGCVVAISVSEQFERINEAAEEWMKAGLKVRLATIAEAMGAFKKCQCGAETSQGSTKAALAR